ncbi:hypothetical protein ACU686_22885 [Yinghuangia aomiensis]
MSDAAGAGCGAAIAGPGADDHGDGSARAVSMLTTTLSRLVPPVASRMRRCVGSTNRVDGSRSPRRRRGRGWRAVRG